MIKAPSTKEEITNKLAELIREQLVSVADEKPHSLAEAKSMAKAWVLELTKEQHAYIEAGEYTTSTVKDMLMSIQDKVRQKYIARQEKLAKNEKLTPKELKGLKLDIEIYLKDMEEVFFNAHTTPKVAGLSSSLCIQVEHCLNLFSSFYPGKDRPFTKNKLYAILRELPYMARSIDTHRQRVTNLSLAIALYYSKQGTTIDKRALIRSAELISKTIHITVREALAAIFQSTVPTPMAVYLNMANHLNSLEKRANFYKRGLGLHPLLHSPLASTNYFYNDDLTKVPAEWDYNAN